MEPVDFLFVDLERLTSYLEQVANPKTVDRKRDWTASFSLTGPRFDIKQESTLRDKTTYEKIASLTRALDNAGLIDRVRPWSMKDNDKPFCLETTMATKVILPAASLARVGLKQFAVWVADPQEIDFTAINDHVANGTFLYLTEAFWDVGSYQTVYSGCSALKAIINIAEGKQFLDQGEDWVLSHPIAKLEELGGIASDCRRIVTLYRKRYMTDELFLGGGRGRGRRCFDLLAYPIFVAVPLTSAAEVPKLREVGDISL